MSYSRPHNAGMHSNLHSTPAQKLGDLIAEGRKAQNLSNQQALADVLHTSQGLVSRWERGLHVPSSTHLATLISVLKLDPEEVYDLVYRATRDAGVA